MLKILAFIYNGILVLQKRRFKSHTAFITGKILYNLNFTLT